MHLGDVISLAVCLSPSSPSLSLSLSLSLDEYEECVQMSGWAQVRRAHRARCEGDRAVESRSCYKEIF
jgi:hypothetical protein